MAATSYVSTNTRPDWGGTAANADIHVEEYEGLIDGSFTTNSIFRTMGLTNFKPLSGTNTYRGNRLGGVAVKGRKSGESVDPQRVVQEKFTLQVDVVSYVRTTSDYADDWTGPDYTQEYSDEHGLAHAKAFDQAHIIQLIKAGAWLAPASLKATGAFYDGITKTMSGYTAETDQAKKADYIERAHRAATTDFVNRDLGDSLAEFATLISPTWFSVLMDHNKLLNVQYTGGNNGSSFAGRRVAEMNGMKLLETPRFPTGAIAGHFLGSAFDVSAAEAKAGMVVYHPKKTLITLEATGMNFRMWDDKKEFTNVLDSYTMYNIGLRRGDACAVIFQD